MSLKLKEYISIHKQYACMMAGDGRTSIRSFLSTLDTSPLNCRLEPLLHPMKLPQYPEGSMKAKLLGGHSLSLSLFFSVISVTRLMELSWPGVLKMSQTSHIFTLWILCGVVLDFWTPKHQNTYVRISCEYVRARRKTQEIPNIQRPPGHAFAGDINGAKAIGS